MAQQHTTPERSLAAAYAAEERAAGVGKESRLRKDPCYELYEESLRCLDENDYDGGACADAFNSFKACRARQRNAKAGVEEGASPLESMLKAQEQDLVFGTIMKVYRMARDAASSAFSEQPQQLQAEPEPEWKVAKRQREEQRQHEQQMRELQAVLQQQQEEQQQQQQAQQRGWRRWFGFKRQQSP